MLIYVAYVSSLTYNHQLIVSRICFPYSAGQQWMVFNGLWLPQAEVAQLQEKGLVSEWSLGIRDGWLGVGKHTLW